MPTDEHATCRRRRTGARRVLFRGAMLTEVLGWSSSVVLVLTIGRQVWRQWQSGHSEGVSTWLFIGQMTASAGFTVYSVLVENWVFVVTNALMLVSAIIGYLVVLTHRRRARAADQASSGREPLLST